MAGFLYCFNTCGDRSVYKVGHTQQAEVSLRLKGYLGPSRPHVVVAVRAVDDSARAESLLLRLLRTSTLFCPRDDLGREWFVRVGEVGESETHLLFLADLVRDAVACRPAPYPTPRAVPCPDDPPSGLPGMEAYLSAATQCIAPTRDRATLAERLQRFEESDACPVYAEYTRYPFATRLAAVADRLSFFPVL